MPHRAHKLKLLADEHAQGRTAELLAEIKQALGVPYVGLVFRAYAVYPSFLELFWQSVRTGVAQAHFFALADRLRASAYTRVYSYFPVPDFCARAEEKQLSVGAREELTSIIALLFYHSAVQLLLAQVAMLAFDHPVGREPQSPQPADHPVFAVRPVLIEETAATPRVARIFEEIRREFGAPLVNTDFRAFARFPDFLEDYWAALRPVARSPLYQESQFGLQDTAAALAREFPAEVDLGKQRMEDAGIAEDDIAAVVRATELFVKMKSNAVLNIALGKIGLDGGTVKQQKPERARHTQRAA